MKPEPIVRKMAAEDGQGADLFDYQLVRDYVGFVLRAPLRHRGIALAAFLFGVLAAAASPLVFPAKYEVQASILALRNPVMSILSNPGLVRGADWDAPTRAARETVLRRDNLVALCEQTHFVDRYLEQRSALGRAKAWLTEKVTGEPQTREDLTEALADTLRSRLWVTVGNEGTVVIGFQWPDKETAFQIVEAAVQNFLEARHTAEISVLGETISLLDARAAHLQQEMNATLTQLEHKERGRPRSPASRLPVIRGQVKRDDDTARLEATLASRRRALADVEAFRSRRQVELHEQLVQKEATYAEQHPEVQSTRQSIAALAQPSPQLEALRGEVRDLEREVTTRGSSTGAGTTSAVQAFGSDLLERRPAIESDDLRYEYDRGQLRLLFDQYSNVMVRADSARLELESSQAAFKYRYSVISPPKIPREAVKPYGLLRVLGGVLGGLALAFFAASVADFRSRVILERWQVERTLGLPVLAEFND